MSSASASSAQLTIETFEEPEEERNDISPEASTTVCADCGAMTPPLWRRGPNGDTVCNACSLYPEPGNRDHATTIRSNNRNPKTTTQVAQRRVTLGLAWSAAVVSQSTIPIFSTVRQNYLPVNTVLI